MDIEDDLTYKIIGCALKVHGFLGNGFQERIYQRALAIEMKRQNLSFQRESPIPNFYDGECIAFQSSTLTNPMNPDPE
jgi:GxxExxY protein